MPSPRQLREVVAAYVNGFTSGDVDTLVALFAHDASVEDPVGTPAKHGEAEIREFYAGAIATGAKLELLGEPRCAGDCVAFPFAVQLTWEGVTQSIEVIDVFRLDEAGKIIEMRAFWGPDNVKTAEA